MAQRIEVILGRGRLWLITVAAFFIFVSNASAAAPPTLSITESDWRTGGVQICFTGGIPGNKVRVYMTSFAEDGVYSLVTERDIDSASQCIIVEPLENGQTVWIKLRQYDPIADEQSAESQPSRQTPPITAYIINWPDMILDINDAITSALEGVFVPTQGAIDDLADAINDLQTALGMGKVEMIGGQLQTIYGDIVDNSSDTIYFDDGVGTWTGGANPGQLPDLTGGTATEMTFCIPITKKPDGSMLEICLFTEEQLEKMKWLKILYMIMAALPWPYFAKYVIARFAPRFKV